MRREEAVGCIASSSEESKTQSKSCWWWGGPSASPQDIVDSDSVEWEKIWKKHGGRARAPWRKRDEVGGKVSATPLCAQELREAAARFKKKTGVAM